MPVRSCFKGPFILGQSTRCNMERQLFSLAFPWGGFPSAASPNTPSPALFVFISSLHLISLIARFTLETGNG